MDSGDSGANDLIDLSLAEIADAIEELGFSCTDCGACCRAESASDEHVATVFPEEVRRIRDRTDGEWRDVARPMPFGMEDGETFEWALQTDECGDCTFYDPDGSSGGCGVYADRPLLCRTYPFQLAIPGVASPNAAVVDSEGPVLAYECEGLGRTIDRADALALARTLKERAAEERSQHEAVLAHFEPRSDETGPVVHDSEGAKTPDGRPIGPET